MHLLCIRMIGGMDITYRHLIMKGFKFFFIELSIRIFLYRISYFRSPFKFAKNNQ